MERWPKHDPSDKPERLREKKEEIRQPTLINRRSFLKGISATLGAQALGFEVLSHVPEVKQYLERRESLIRFERGWQGLNAEEREARIEEVTARYGELVRSAEGERILSEGSDDELFELLRLAPPLLREYLAGTKYTISSHEWPSVLLPCATPEINTQLPIFDTLSKAAVTDGKRLNYGNGVFVDTNTILTNIHVLRLRYELPPTFETQVRERGIDAVYAHLPVPKHPDMIAQKIEELADEMRVTLPLSERSDQDIHGKFIMVAGIDPDESAAPDGTKVYPAVALKMTQNLGDFFDRHNTWGRDFSTVGPELLNSFVYLAPPGESALPHTPQGTPEYGKVLLKGTSGSPVLMQSGSKKELVGLNAMCMQVGYQKKLAGIDFDLGFFLGPDTLREARAFHMEVDLPI